MHLVLTCDDFSSVIGEHFTNHIYIYICILFIRYFKRWNAHWGSSCSIFWDITTQRPCPLGYEKKQEPTNIKVLDLIRFQKQLQLSSWILQLTSKLFSITESVVTYWKSTIFFLLKAAMQSKAKQSKALHCLTPPSKQFLWSKHQCK